MKKLNSMPWKEPWPGFLSEGRKGTTRHFACPFLGFVSCQKRQKDLGNDIQLDTERLLSRANIPGIPEEMDARLEEAAERIYVVVQSLQEVPLNVVQVNQHLFSAKQSIEDTHDKAQEMIKLLAQRKFNH